jgi:hypothetical protein
MDEDLKNLKEYAIEDIWGLYSNKYKGLVVLMREARRVLLQFQIEEIEFPGEKAILQATKNYKDKKVRVAEGM